MTWSRDLRYATRQLLRAPGFAVTVVLTLALGIGANLAIFQLLYAAIFAPLPIAQPNQLFSLRAVKSPFDGQWFFSYPAYQRLREATANTAPVIARSGFSEGVFQPSGRSPERVSLQMVSSNFFDVLGLAPANGRFFSADDEGTAQARLPCILRYGFWKQSFGSDLSVIGKPAVLNGVMIVIIGIAPNHFSGVVAGEAPDLWLPLTAQATGRFHSWFDSLGPGSGADIRAPYMNQAGVFWLWILARVPQVAQSSAVAHWTAALAPDLELLARASRDARDQEQIRSSRVQLVSAASGEGTLREDYSQSLLILMMMAMLVFLVGCVNLANLQLARLLGRQRELTVRASLGATPWPLLRQLLTEDLLLALLGALFALITGPAFSAILARWASGSGPRIPLDLRVGWQVFAVGTALLLFALTAFSVIPAWRSTRNILIDSMKSKTASSSSHGRAARKWSNFLLAGQVSLSLLLLGTAALFAQTLVNLSHVNAGLDRDHLISIHLDLTNAGYDSANLSPLYQRIIANLKQLPGVRDAAVQMCAIPGCVWNTAVHVAGHPELSEKLMHSEENRVGAGYFHTLGIPILRGRDFDERDLPASQPVAVLSHALSTNLFGSESPLGHRIGYERAPGDADYLIVGEVGDARVDDLRSPPPPVAYFSIAQRPARAGTVMVRANELRRGLSSSIRQSLLSVDSELPITAIMPLSSEYENGLSKETLLARLTATFGSLALALAALGFYGLLSFNVTRRTSEIGIRIAIGASRRDVYALVLRQTAGILIAGIIPGLVLTEAMAFVARGLLFGTGMLDFWPLLYAILVLITAGVLASLRPANQAALIDPVRALHAD